MTDATTANSPTNELSDDEVRKLLDWCREHAAEADALTTLNDLGATLLRPSVGKDSIAVVNAILDELEKDAEPSAHVHAHMMILLSTLLEHRTQRDAVDAILLRWMRHPKSFGPARATPPELQKDGFVQRLADALGWGSLSLDAEKDGIARLLAWVDTWAPKQKASAGRIVAMMRRNFPQGGELWKLVRVEFNRDKNHKGHDRRDRDRDRRNHKDRPKNEAPKSAEGSEASASVEGAATTEGAEGAALVEGAAPTADGAAAVAGATADGAKKKRRRRRRKRKPADGTTAAAGAVAAEGAEGAEDGDDGDDGDDGAPEGGESAPSAAPEAPAGGDSSGG
ncbi:MAG: hypothetical protein U0269_27075 [Polyangiales bacterium]